MLGYDDWLEGPRGRRGGAPCRPGARLPRDGRGVLRGRAAPGGLRHRDPLARHQHAGPLGGDRALHQVRRRRAGHPDLGRVPPADRPGRSAWPRRGGPRGRASGPPRPPSAKRPGWPRPRRPTCARPSGPPTTWPSTWSRRFDRRTANEVLQRSFAQWQAQRPDLLAQQLSHRVAVLEDLGYVDGLVAHRRPGHRLARIYHESRPAGGRGVGRRRSSTARSPPILAGVLSSVVFEPRRARRLAGHRGKQPPARRDRRKKAAPDRLGEKRLADLRLALRRPASRGRPHPGGRGGSPGAPHPPAVPGLATAVTSWARGASFGTALGWRPATSATSPRATSCAR